MIAFHVKYITRVIGFNLRMKTTVLSWGVNAFPAAWRGFSPSSRGKAQVRAHSPYHGGCDSGLKTSERKVRGRRENKWAIFFVSLHAVAGHPFSFPPSLSFLFIPFYHCFGQMTAQVSSPIPNRIDNRWRCKKLMTNILVQEA